MTKTTIATFTGAALIPEDVTDLESEHRYLLLIREVTPDRAIVEDDPAFDLASLAMETGVPDLASEHDHYLYGTPKRHARHE